MEILRPHLSKENKQFRNSINAKESLNALVLLAATQLMLERVTVVDAVVASDMMMMMIGASGTVAAFKLAIRMVTDEAFGSERETVAALMLTMVLEIVFTWDQMTAGADVQNRLRWRLIIYH